MIRRLQLGRVYFAGKGGVRVVHQDGSEYRRAEGYQLRLTAWPTKIEGEIIDSRGHVVSFVQDAMRRVAEDKVLS